MCRQSLHTNSLQTFILKCVSSLSPGKVEGAPGPDPCRHRNSPGRTGNRAAEKYHPMWETSDSCPYLHLHRPSPTDVAKQTKTAAKEVALVC